MLDNPLAVVTIIFLIGGFVFTVSQFAFLFLWNNLKNDIKETKSDNEKAVNLLWDEVRKKATIADATEHKDDIKALSNKIEDTQATTLKEVRDRLAEHKDQIVAEMELRIPNGNGNGISRRRRGRR